MVFRLKTLCAAAIIAVAAVPGAASAATDCDSYPTDPQQTVSFGTLQLPPVPVPVGTILAERLTLPWNPPPFVCRHFTPIAPKLDLEYLGQQAATTASGVIYRTNVPGVGIRIAFESDSGMRTTAGDETDVSQDTRTILVPRQPIVIRNGRFRVQLVKTDAIVEGGSLPNGPLASLALRDNQGLFAGPVQASIVLSDSHIVVPKPAQP